MEKMFENEKRGNKKKHGKIDAERPCQEEYYYYDQDEYCGQDEYEDPEN